MYLLYVDESGDPGLRAKATRHYILSGIAMFEGAWRKTSEAVDRLQSQFFPSAVARVEFHFEHIHHAKGIFAALDKAQRSDLVKNLATIWQSHRLDFTSFCVVLDKHTCGPLGNTVEQEVFEQLCSRFNLFLKRKWAEGLWHKGIIVFDRRTSTQDRILQQLQTKFQHQGSRWAPLDNVIETVFTLPSHDTRILQLADFLAGRSSKPLRIGIPHICRLFPHTSILKFKRI